MGLVKLSIFAALFVAVQGQAQTSLKETKVEKIISQQLDRLIEKQEEAMLKGYEESAARKKNDR